MGSSAWWAENDLVFFPGRGRGNNPLDDDIPSRVDTPQKGTKRLRQMVEQGALTRDPNPDEEQVIDGVRFVKGPGSMWHTVPRTRRQ